MVPLSWTLMVPTMDPHVHFWKIFRILSLGHKIYMGSIFLLFLNQIIIRMKWIINMVIFDQTYFTVTVKVYYKKVKEQE